MAQMLVRNIEVEVAERFKARARAEGKSTEQALRDLIADYARDRKIDALAQIDAIRKRLGASTLDPVELIRADRDGDHDRH